MADAVPFLMFEPPKTGSAGGAMEPHPSSGWVDDRFGVSWQLAGPAAP